MTFDDAPKKRSGVRTLVIVLAVSAGITLIGCLACGVGGYFWVDQNAAGMRQAAESTFARKYATSCARHLAATCCCSFESAL